MSYIVNQISLCAISLIDRELDVYRIGIIKIGDNNLSSFVEHEIQIPPRIDLRNFNEHDILGYFDKDSKGDNLISTD